MVTVEMLAKLNRGKPTLGIIPTGMCAYPILRHNIVHRVVATSVCTPDMQQSILHLHKRICARVLNNTLQFVLWLA